MVLLCRCSSGGLWIPERKDLVLLCDASGLGYWVPIVGLLCALGSNTTMLRPWLLQTPLKSQAHFFVTRISVTSSEVIPVRAKVRCFPVLNGKDGFFFFSFFLLFLRSLAHSVHSRTAWAWMLSRRVPKRVRLLLRVGGVVGFIFFSRRRLWFASCSDASCGRVVHIASHNKRGN